MCYICQIPDPMERNMRLHEVMRGALRGDDSMNVEVMKVSACLLEQLAGHLRKRFGLTLHEAEAVAQGAFTKVLLNAEAVTDGRFTVVLYKAATHGTYDLFRRRRTARSFLKTFIEDMPPACSRSPEVEDPDLFGLRMFLEGLHEQARKDLDRLLDQDPPVEQVEEAAKIFERRGKSVHAGTASRILDRILVALFEERVPLAVLLALVKRAPVLSLHLYRASFERDGEDAAKLRSLVALARGRCEEDPGRSRIAG